MTPLEPDEQRAAGRRMWERAAERWGSRADRVRAYGMPVSVAMIEALDLQPGQRVLELAAGPGDTGFMAAELIAPGGTLICSDGADAMLEVARRRALEMGIANVEFRPLELEWIDLPTADVDAVLCRWGIMLTVDPQAAAHEIRRVLRPGGRAALAVWDLPAANPWATIPSRALIELGHSEPPEPDSPGMFRLADPGRLEELLHDGGFQEVAVVAVAIEHRYDNVDQFIAETIALSMMFDAAYSPLDGDRRAQVRRAIAAAAAPFQAPDGSLLLSGSSLVASAVG
ncbi:MAG: methyltransferase domain-containing protein [Solirubrobacteraceae bacterium]